MKIESYLQQYRRVLRFLKRIENQDRDQTDYVDDMWSFFQHCHHLKDWIKNDPQVSRHVSSKIENKVNKSQSLRIVADLANRSKHLRLNSPRSNADIKHIGVVINVPVLEILLKKQTISKKECNPEYHLTINTSDGNTLDGLQLAKDAINEWNRIFDELCLKKS